MSEHTTETDTEPGASMTLASAPSDTPELLGSTDYAMSIVSIRSQPIVELENMWIAEDRVLQSDLQIALQNLEQEEKQIIKCIQYKFKIEKQRVIDITHAKQSCLDQERTKTIYSTYKIYKGHHTSWYNTIIYTVLAFLNIL